MPVKFIWEEKCSFLIEPKALLGMLIFTWHNYLSWTCLITLLFLKTLSCKWKLVTFANSPVSRGGVGTLLCPWNVLIFHGWQHTWAFFCKCITCIFMPPTGGGICRCKCSLLIKQNYTCYVFQNNCWHELITDATGTNRKVTLREHLYV